MRVALSWWPPQPQPGGRAQAITGNVRGFLEAGHDVDLYWKQDLGELRERADDYDVIVAPYFDEHFDDLATPHVLQVGGYDSPQHPSEYFVDAFNRADVTVLLDPGLALHFANLAGLVLDRVFIVPNAPNRRLFDRRPHDEEEGFVLVPKIGGPYKSADLLNEIAVASMDTLYETHVSGEPPQLYPNVVKRPGVPLSSMPRRYARASIVCNPSVREGLPNVAYEAFLTQRPFVATADGIGLLQTVPADVIAAFTPGATAQAVLDEYQTHFHSGEHYRTAAPSHLGDLIPDLLHDVDERHAVAAAGRRWIEAFDYTWAEKAATIAALVDEL